jgi:hypothetical protein
MTTVPDVPYEEEAQEELYVDELQARREKDQDEATQHLMDPPGSEAESPDVFAPADALEAAETEEVYVILPDEDVSDVPLVETEAVDDLEVLDAADEMSDEELAEVAMRSQAIDGAEVANALTSEVDEQAPYEENESLDAIASELDEEMFSYAPDGADEELPYLESMEAEGILFGELETNEEPEAVASTSRGRSAYRKLVSLAALLALAAVGVYFGYPKFQEWKARGFPPFGSGAAEVATTTGQDLGTSGNVGVLDTEPRNPDSGTDTPGGATTPAGGSSEDPVEVARVSLREQYRLALQLGFVGEVGNE